MLLGAQNDPAVPFRVLTKYRTLAQIRHAPASELAGIKGMTPHRIAVLQAALEIGERARTDAGEEPPTIKSPADAAELLYPTMSDQPQEHMRVLVLNAKNRVIDNVLVYQGSLHTTVIRVSEIFTACVAARAAAVIVAHCHPSGDPTPSPEDVAVTTEISKAGKILDIDVLYHLVIGSGRRFTSLKERGLGFV